MIKRIFGLLVLKPKEYSNTKINIHLSLTIYICIYMYEFNEQFNESLSWIIIVFCVGGSKGSIVPYCVKLAAIELWLDSYRMLDH